MSDVNTDTGVILEALNDKADRDMNNVADGIDFVVDSYKNGTEWYRLYKSGWVEQGGWIQNTTGVGDVVLPVTMSDNKYTISGISDNNSGVAGSFTMIDGNSATTTGFRIVVNFSGNNPATKTIRWKVEGMSSQS